MTTEYVDLWNVMAEDAALKQVTELVKNNDGRCCYVRLVGLVRCNEDRLEDGFFCKGHHNYIGKDHPYHQFKTKRNYDNPIDKVSNLVESIKRRKDDGVCCYISMKEHKRCDTPYRSGRFFCMLHQKTINKNHPFYKFKAESSRISHRHEAIKRVSENIRSVDDNERCCYVDIMSLERCIRVRSKRTVFCRVHGRHINKEHPFYGLKMENI